MSLIAIWLKKFNLLQIIAILAAISLMLSAHWQWLHIFPTQQVGRWLKYVPIHLELVRFYSGKDLLGIYTWTPIIYLLLLLSHSYKKALLLAIPLFAFLSLQEAYRFAEKLKNALPFGEYFKDYVAAHQLLWPIYLYGGLYLILAAYSIYTLFEKNKN